MLMRILFAQTFLTLVTYAAVGDLSHVHIATEIFFNLPPIAELINDHARPLLPFSSHEEPQNLIDDLAVNLENQGMVEMAAGLASPGRQKISGIFDALSLLLVFTVDETATRHQLESLLQLRILYMNRCHNQNHDPSDPDIQKVMIRISHQLEPEQGTLSIDQIVARKFQARLSSQTHCHECHEQLHCFNPILALPDVLEIAIIRPLGDSTLVQVTENLNLENFAHSIDVGPMRYTLRAIVFESATEGGDTFTGAIKIGSDWFNLDSHGNRTPGAPQLESSTVSTIFYQRLSQ